MFDELLMGFDKLKAHFAHYYIILVLVYVGFPFLVEMELLHGEKNSCYTRGRSSKFLLMFACNFLKVKVEQ